MVDFTYDDLARDIGTSTADGLRNLANTAANVYCDAYAAYAGAFAPSTSPIGLVRAIDAFNSRLCSPRNKRPANPPALPFTGGQCPIRYRVDYLSTQPAGTSTGTVFNLLGPVRGVAIDPEPGNRRRFSIWGAPDPPGRPDGKVGVLVSGSPGDPSQFGVQITSVSTMSGGPDTCGDPQPGYPPVVAPSVSLNAPVSVNLGGFTLNANAVIIAPKFSANVDLDVGVNVKIGDFNVKFDAGGVTISNEFKPNVDISLPDGGGTDGRSNPPPPRDVERSDDCGKVLQPNLKKIEDLLEDIKECACEDTEEVTVSFPTRNNAIINSPSLDIVWIRLNITTDPEQVRSQWGGGLAPDVYYIGWYAWGGESGSGFGDRRPISYANNWFFPPKGIRSFSYTLHVGQSASVTMRYKRPKQ